MHEQSELIDLKIRVFTRIFGRRRDFELSITFSELGIKPTSWLAQAFFSLSYQSYQQEPIIRSRVDNLTRVFRYVRDSREVMDLLNLPRDKLKTDDIYHLYFYIENTLATFEFPVKSARPTLSGAFRTFVKHHLPQSTASPIASEGIRYRSTFPQARTPRPILNLNEAIGKSESNLLGAIEFESHTELIQKSLIALTDDLNLIMSACKTDMDYFDTVRSTLNALINTQTTEELDESVERLIVKSHFKSYEVKFFETSPDKLILSAYLKSIQRLRLHRVDSPNWWRYRPIELLESVGISVLEGQTTRQVYNSIYRLSNQELEVVMLLLLCRTGWNRDALLSLTTEGISRRQDGSYYIQGYKNKTEAHTPPVIIDKSEKYEIRAIRLILWNRVKLIRLGFIDRHDTKLWYGWTQSIEKLHSFPTNLYRSPPHFRTRHSLPNFTAEQIRTQVLNITNYERKNIEDTRRVAGHTSITTTGSYLDQIINHNINSSINLDFQKKLQAKITFNLNKRASAHSTPSSTLTPIGDGSMCKDPTSPPTQILNNLGLCPALSCHKGDGCANRVIHIDFERAEEIIRTKRYYRDNWKRLHAENQARFEKNIAPIMLFNIIIYDYIKSSAHSHIFNKIERGIFSE